MQISDYNKCPHCGGEGGYYQKLFVSGWIRDNRTWKDKSENTEMWDNINYRKEGKYYYCIDCNKRICKVSE